MRAKNDSTDRLLPNSTLYIVNSSATLQHDALTIPDSTSALFIRCLKGI